MVYMTCMQDQSYYYLSHDKKPMGPLSRPQLEARLSMGEIETTTLVAAVGGTDWLPLGDLLGLEGKEETDSAAAALIASSTLSCPHCEKEQSVTQDTALLQCAACAKVVAPDPNSSLWAHFMSCMRRYASFKGRATRKEYWGFYLFYAIFSIPAFVGLFISIMMKVMPEFMAQVDTNKEAAMAALEARTAELSSGEGMLHAGGAIQVWYLISVIVAYFFLLPMLAVTVRRFHDVGFSGYVPCLSAILGQAMSLYVFFSVGSKDSMMMFNTLSSILGLIVLVFAFLDSKRGSNKYGPSSKYPHS